MRLTAAPIALVLTAALAAGGCGGGSKSDAKSATATTPAATTPRTSTQPAGPVKAGSAAEATRRLRLGGYSVSEIDVNPPATAARKVGDHVLFYEYKTPAAAKDGAAVIKDAIKAHPERGVLDVEGRRVYFVGQTHAVTAKERAAFADLVDVGEGR